MHHRSGHNAKVVGHRYLKVVGLYLYEFRRLKYLMTFRIFTTFITSFFILLSAPFAADTDNYISRSGRYSEELLGIINYYRISHGLKPLLSNEKLTALAKSHCYDMHRQAVLNHDKFDERFKKSGSSSCVENVGWNYHKPGDQFTAWKNSEGHDRNMLDRSVRIAGISKVGAYVTFFACN